MMPSGTQVEMLGTSWPIFSSEILPVPKVVTITLVGVATPIAYDT